MRLHINDIFLNVTLGVFDEEQLAPQNVIANVTYHFHDKVLACLSDDYHETICYAKVAETLQQACDKKSFKLVEHLAWQLSETLVKACDKPADISIAVTKKAPLEHIDSCTIEIERPWSTM